MNLIRCSDIPTFHYSSFPSFLSSSIPLVLGSLRRLPCCKRERRRSIEQLDPGVEVNKSRAAQLAAGRQEIGECLKASAVRLQNRFVRLLRGIHQGCGDIKPAHSEPDVGVCLPYLANSPVAGGCYLGFGGPPLGLGEFHLPPGGASLE